MKSVFSKKIILKIAILFSVVFVFFFLFRFVKLLPRSYGPQTTVQFTENNLSPWSSKVRYLRRLFGIYADSFVIIGGQNIRFKENHVEFNSRGHLTYIDLPLSRRIDAEKVNGIRIVMSFEPELHEFDKFLMDIGRYHSRMGVLFGENLEHTLNVPLKSGDQWQEYSIYLAGFSDWHNKVDSLRIIPSLGSGSIRMREISFLEAIPPEALQLEEITLGPNKKNMVYLSDIQETLEGVITLEERLELSFLEPLNVPAEKINFMELELDYSYRPPIHYLLFYNRDGNIVQYQPLKRENNSYVADINIQEDKFEYLGIYLPPDRTDKLIQEITLSYENNRYNSIALNPFHNNALIGDRNNFAIFLTRQEKPPSFLLDSDIVVRYIMQNYSREGLFHINISFKEVSEKNPLIKLSWQNDHGSRQQLYTFEYPLETVFLGQHPAFDKSIYHLSFIMENFFGPVKLHRINFQEASGKRKTYNELAQTLFDKGLFFQNHGDCNSFKFKDGYYVTGARLEKGRIWSRQFPLISDSMETIKIRYRLTGEPMIIKVHLLSGDTVESTAKLQTYNEPFHLKVFIPELSEPLRGIQFISPILLNWGKIENLSVRGTDPRGERHQAFLSTPERMMPSEDLSKVIIDEIAEGEFLLLEDMEMIHNVEIKFDYTYSPNNRPYFYWYSQNKGLQTYPLDGILANGKEDEIRIPLSIIEEEIIPVWGLSLFWCPGILEILHIELEVND